MFTEKKKKRCLSHIGCVCLVFTIYNPNLQLQICSCAYYFRVYYNKYYCLLKKKKSFYTREGNRAASKVFNMTPNDSG